MPKNTDDLHSLLGYQGEDQITGIRGMITAVTYYISGCNQVLLTTKIDKKHRGEQIWVDVQRVTIDRSSRFVLDNGNTPGHDIPAPIR